MDEKKRIFSEQEVGEIVRRAVQLQEQAKDAELYTPGITREELSRIAREMGIDPKYLEMAIGTSKVSPDPKRGVFNLTQEFERVVDGELKQEDFDLLLEHVRARPGPHGPSIAQIGRTLSGRSTKGIFSSIIDVTSRKGRTKISVRSSPVFAYLVALHPAVIGSIIAMAAFGEQGSISAGIATAAGLLTVGGIAFKELV
ncbi:MAG TPA: hypothetical protein VEX38_03530, partial [Fimbriimonadaceae bacterium]|nr:hypothetical protein [Fimbriimonadaceae bacterium]